MLNSLIKLKILDYTKSNQRPKKYSHFLIFIFNIILENKLLY